HGSALWMLAVMMIALRLLPVAVGLLPLALGAASQPTDPPVKAVKPDRIALRIEVFGPAGLHVVTNKTDVEETGDRYTIKAELATRGLAGFFVNMKSHAEVRGRLNGDAA